MLLSLSYFSKKIKAMLFIIKKKKKQKKQNPKKYHSKKPPKLFSTVSRVDNIECMLKN